MITAKLIRKVGLSCVICLGATAVVNAQKQSAVASGTKQIILSQSTPGATTTPWVTVLKTTYDTSGSGGAIVVGTSAVTSLFSADVRAISQAILIDNTGIQGRVLIDCTGNCQGTAPAAKIADPGVITLDQAYHYIQVISADTFNVAIDQTAAAHSFNFFRVGLSPDVHTIQFQVRFQVDTSALPAGLTLDSVMAGVGSRTLVILPTRVGPLLDDNEQ